MSKTVVTAIAGVLCIAAIAHYATQASIEEDRQEAFMMKACVDAGGQWERKWARQRICKRTEIAR